MTSTGLPFVSQLSDNLNEFLTKHNILLGLNPKESGEFTLRHIQVDDSLNHDSAQVTGVNKNRVYDIASVQSFIKNKYLQYLHIYVDGSVIDDIGAASAVCIPDRGYTSPLLPFSRNYLP